MKFTTLILLVAVALLCATTFASAMPLERPADKPKPGDGAPTIVSYQGQVKLDGALYSGTGYLKLAIVNATGDQTFWSNDGSSAAGSPPGTAVQVSVSNSIFNILLGDTTLANMQALAGVGFCGNGTLFACLVRFRSGRPVHLARAGSPDRDSPYAFQAEQAKTAASSDTLAGRAETEFLLADGSRAGATVQKQEFANGIKTDVIQERVPGSGISLGAAGQSTKTWFGTDNPRAPSGG